MLAGIILFFMCEIYALIVAVLGGSLIDILESTFDKAGFFIVGDNWNFDAYTAMVNLFYLTPYVIAILGIVILVVTIWHRHGKDQELPEDYSTGDSDL